MCGKIIGYQQGSPDGFSPYICGGQTTIDSSNVEGISLTHGTHPRKHIFGHLLQHFTNTTYTLGVHVRGLQYLGLCLSVCVSVCLAASASVYTCNQ